MLKATDTETVRRIPQLPAKIIKILFIIYIDIDRLIQLKIRSPSQTVHPKASTAYQNNAVIISQCVNMGRVKADNASRIGGIVGHMQQYGIVKDCLNGGRYEGNSTKAGGIVGRGDSRFEAHNCLNVGDKWKDPLINSYGDFTSLSNLYYYGQPVIYENNSYLTNLSIDELCDPKKYKNWNINKTNSIWHVTESKGNFPVPFHSEMEEEIKE